MPFLRGLKAAGYVEGQNVAIEYQWAEGQNDRLAALAADLVNRELAVIVRGGTSQQGKAATSTLPVVFTTGGSPDNVGLGVKHNRPGGHIARTDLQSRAL